MGCGDSGVQSQRAEQQGILHSTWAFGFPPLVSSMYQVGRVRALTYSYKPRCVFVRRHSRQKKPRRSARLFCLCWHYLSSRQVTLQVLSAQMSLTSVFGMGTGGPSSQSIPTRVDGVEPSFMSKPSWVLTALCFSLAYLVTRTGFEPMLKA